MEKPSRRRRWEQTTVSGETVKLPRDVIMTYLDTEHDLLFIRFREPRGVEVGEPLPLKTPVTLFTEEDTGEVTALEVIGISKLLIEF